MGAEGVKVETNNDDLIQTLGCVVIIPVYNHAQTVASVIIDVKRFTSDIIIVDDGSTDETSSVLSSIKDVKVITLPKNRGKGYALKVAMDEALNAGYTYAITLDADAQHTADDIPLFLQEITRYPQSLVVGARNLKAENMPSQNTFANKFSNFWFKLETGNALADTQSGFRLYPLSLFRDIRFYTDRYEFEVEVLVRASWHGYRISNVPIHVSYSPRGQRISHFKPLRDFMRISLLNAVLVIWALFCYYPKKMCADLSWDEIRFFFLKNIIRSKENNRALSSAMAWGVFCGILPIWGYQMVFATITAHFMRLNKIIVLAFSNISIPPLIPLILYGSLLMGTAVLQTPLDLSINQMSLASVKTMITPYLLGSMLLALIMGILTFGISWCVLTLFRKEGGR